MGVGRRQERWGSGEKEEWKKKGEAGGEGEKVDDGEEVGEKGEEETE